MKNTILFIAIVFIAVACKKKDSPAPSMTIAQAFDSLKIQAGKPYVKSRTVDNRDTVWFYTDGSIIESCKPSNSNLQTKIRYTIGVSTDYYTFGSNKFLRINFKLATDTFTFVTESRYGANLFYDLANCSHTIGLNPLPTDTTFQVTNRDYNFRTFYLVH